MGSKINYALKKSKSVFIIMIILWIAISIVLIAPLSIAWGEAVVRGNGDFIDIMVNTNFGDISGNLGKAFSGNNVGIFLKCELWLTIALMAFAIIRNDKNHAKT